MGRIKNHKNITISKKKLVIFLTSLFVMAILIMAFWLNGISSIKDLFTNDQALEKTYYLMQIICSVVVIIGGIIGVWQYVLAKRAEWIQYHNSRIQKAIDLSEYYKDHVLCNMKIIRSVYDKSGVLNILNSIKKENIRRFDVRELDDNLDRQQKSTIKEILQSEEFVKIIADAASVYSDVDMFVEKVFMHENEKVIEVTKINRTKAIEFFKNEIVCGTLNNLEYFAMHFNYETADKKTVYQSLHQTYLDIVRILYYDISVNNETAEQKLYTNVIELYIAWNKMAEEQTHNETKSASTAIVKGNTALTVE